MSVPNSYFISSAFPLSPLITVSLFSVYESICFVNIFVYIHILKILCVSDIIMAFVFLCLTDFAQSF